MIHERLYSDSLQKAPAEFGELKEVSECMDEGIDYSDFPQKVKNIRKSINADFKISNIKEVNNKFYNVLHGAIRLDK